MSRRRTHSALRLLREHGAPEAEFVPTLHRCLWSLGVFSVPLPAFAPVRYSVLFMTLVFLLPWATICAFTGRAEWIGFVALGAALGCVLQAIGWRRRARLYQVPPWECLDEPGGEPFDTAGSID